MQLRNAGSPGARLLPALPGLLAWPQAVARARAAKADQQDVVRAQRLEGPHDLVPHGHAEAVHAAQVHAAAVGQLHLAHILLQHRVGHAPAQQPIARHSLECSTGRASKAPAQCREPTAGRQPPWRPWAGNLNSL